MSDIITSLFVIIQFLATEKVISWAGGKIAESIGKPIFEAVEEKAKWISGQDDTSKRWNSFCKAFEESKKRFHQQSNNPEIAELILDALKKFDNYPKNQIDLLIPLSDEFEKLSLVTEQPDINLLVDLCKRIYEQSGELVPPENDIEDGMRDFIRIFQDRLFAQPPYRELMLDKALWEKLRGKKYDTKLRYLEQIINNNQTLEFVGIPEIKDRLAIRIEEVFIHLRAEAESDKEFSDNKISDIPINNQSNFSINHALEKFSKLVILGDPGAGKTTLLKYIVLAFAHKQSEKLGLHEDRLPIFIRLYDFISCRSILRSYSLIDYMYTYAHENLTLDMEKGFFESELEKGNCCVCLDGLDELGEAGVRRLASTVVTSLINRFPKNRYIVTSRIVGYNDAPLDRYEFVHYVILPLLDADIQTFVSKWYLAREKDRSIATTRSENLFNTIIEEPRIKNLAANPLMLTIIALVHRIEAELPNERVRLYEKCVSTLVETWEKAKGLTIYERQRPYYRFRRRLLEQLAYWMHSDIVDKTDPNAESPRQIKEGDLELYITLFLTDNPKLKLDEETAHQEAHEFISLVKARTGLLVERGEGIYTFAHLTFQEYLTACEIEHMYAHSIDDVWKQIKPILHSSHWREVILLLMGNLNRFEKHPTELIKRIIEEKDIYEDVLHRNLYLAARILADHVDVEYTLHDKIIDNLIWIVRYDPVSCEDAVASLGLLYEDKYAAKQLLILATNHFFKKSLDSALPLSGSEIENHSALEGFFKRQLNISEKIDSDKKVFTAIQDVLGADIYNLQFKNEVLDPNVILQIGIALGRIGHLTLGAWILERLQKSTQSEDLRFEALEALNRLGKVDINSLYSLANDKSETMERRYNASISLAKLGFENDALDQLAQLQFEINQRKKAPKIGEQSLSTSQSNYFKPTPLEIKIEKLVKEISHAENERSTRLGLSEFIYTIRKLRQNDPLNKNKTLDDTALLIEIITEKRYPESLRKEAIRYIGLASSLIDLTISKLSNIMQDRKVDTEFRIAAAQAMITLGNSEESNDFLYLVSIDSNEPVNNRIDALRALGASCISNKNILMDIMNLIVNQYTPKSVRLAAYRCIKQLSAT
jgi:hypothetical protein